MTLAGSHRGGLRHAVAWLCAVALLQGAAPLRAGESSAGLCSPDPELNAQALIVTPAIDAATMRDRMLADPAYAARFGNPSVTPLRIDGGAFVSMTFGYPPLRDPAVELERLRGLPEIASVYANGRVCLSPPPPDVLADVVEFHHAGLDQYFYSADAGEVAAIEAGRVGAGWVRTGQAFRVVVAPGCPFARDAPVYRFAAAQGGATGSHVFTRDRAECHVVDATRQWTFEGVPFWASTPAPDGRCPGDGVPLARTWRPFGASTHRFTTNPDVASEMRARGWIVEGPAMCVRAAAR
jgi:hypothetical protein